MMKRLSLRAGVAGLVLLAVFGWHGRADAEVKFSLTFELDAEPGGGDPSTGKRDIEKHVIIRSIEPDSESKPARDLAWLGVGVQDAPEALGAQLGLKYGEGLLVTYVTPDSPAAKAGLTNHDVLVDFEGQMLVSSIQLRKLVQMRDEGENVKVTFYRGGKKQATNARLIKKSRSESSLEEGPTHPGFQKVVQFQVGDGANSGSLDEQMKALAQSLENLGFDKERMQAEIVSTVDQTRKAIEEAVRHTADEHGLHRGMTNLENELADVAHSGVNVGRDTTVVIKNHDKSARSIVKTDETGCYFIFAHPEKHLTVHDKSGRLLFDGAIESPDQQRKAPREIWERVKPLVEQIDQEKVAPETASLPPKEFQPANPPNKK